MKPKKDEEIFLSEATTAMLKQKLVGCFLCRIILEDQELHGKLTGHPNDMFDKGTFPVEAKVRHIQLEKMHFEPAGGPKAPQQEEGK